MEKNFKNNDKKEECLDIKSPVKSEKLAEQSVSRTSIYLSRPKKYITRDKTLGG